MRRIDCFMSAPSHFWTICPEVLQITLFRFCLSLLLLLPISLLDNLSRSSASEKGNERESRRKNLPLRQYYSPSVLRPLVLRPYSIYSFGIPLYGIPLHDIPFHGMPSDGITFHGIPFDDIPFDGIPFFGIPSVGLP